jgi:hypothetical protein
VLLAGVCVQYSELVRLGIKLGSLLPPRSQYDALTQWLLPMQRQQQRGQGQ